MTVLAAENKEFWAFLTLSNVRFSLKSKFRDKTTKITVFRFLKLFQIELFQAFERVIWGRFSSESHTGKKLDIDPNFQN